jgi:AcrR family transcriptional regulator
MVASKALAAARKLRSAPTGDESADSTRDRILDAAERQFATHAIEEVTLRDVTSAAGVNLAAVHYHFGSRDDLLRAILVRRMTPLLEERKRRLSFLPREGTVHEKIEHIVRAFIEPSMEYDCSNDNYLVHRLITRLAIYEERDPIDLFQFTLADTHAKFLDALTGVLPDLDRERLGYRFEFMLGLLSHATALRARLIGADHEIHGIATPDRLLLELIASTIAVFCPA